MRPIPPGRRARRAFDTGSEHSADAIGNTGVAVVASAALIWFLEIACCDAIESFLEPGEVSLGVGFDMTHLAPAAIGARVEAAARVAAVSGRKIDFDVEAYEAGRLLMSGRHRRAVVALRDFLAQCRPLAGTGDEA